MSDTMRPILETERTGITTLASVATMVAMLLASTTIPTGALAHGSHDEQAQATGQALVEDSTSWLDALLEELLLGSVEAAATVSITANGTVRTIIADGLPDHAPGQFPNANNPNSVSAQSYRFEMPTDPTIGSAPTSLDTYVFGVALNGVIFDPATAEFWNNDRASGWNYEAFGPQTRSLGLDTSNAHVQPNGAYHYHGIPDALYERLANASEPTLLGYAADGFPIYGPLAYAVSDDPSSGLEIMTSSYVLRSGTRPSGPGGAYDGTFTADWEYMPGSGTLDACNGRTGVTPDYPNGTYYYVITDDFPFIPRCLVGEPDDSFSKRNARGGQQGLERPARPEGERGSLRRPPRPHSPIR